jgi:cell surface protein SprA
LALTRKNYLAYSVGRFVVAYVCFLFFPQEAFAQRQDTTRYQPTRRPTFRPSDRYGDPFSHSTTESPLFLKDPNKLELDVEIDTALNYTIYEKIGDLNYRPTTSMSFNEFKQYQDRQILKSYWQNRSRAVDGESAVSGRGFTPKIFISPILDRIFGGSYVELVPRGFVTLDFGGSFQKISDPRINIRQQRNGGFEFDQQINMSVVGKVGEKLAVTANFDNNNSFDFQNNMKVEYTGFKEDILQKLEIGNVSLPLNNTLIQGAQNLFGIKAQLQFGKLNVTTIASTQRGKVESIEIPGGGNGQGRPFELIASNYDENRHFFLGHFFRENYRSWIANLPQITSGVNVTRVEVYLVNRNNDTQTIRDVIGLMDLGEARTIHNKSAVSSPNPNRPNDNESNSLYDQVKIKQRNSDVINSELEGIFGNGTAGTDFEKITSARKLNPTEFTFHHQLGYITLTRKLQNDEALAVAYEYTYNGQSFKVGELSEDYSDLEDDDVIFLKLLRQRDLSKFVRMPTWNLMMKNIYNLNVNQLTREGFQLRIIYRDDRTGIDNPQLQEGSNTLRERQLIEILGLDKLNPVNDPQRDGNFDYVDGITINATTGLIIFPYLEPFSDALREAFANQANEDFLIKKYSYDTLYRTTKADAELFATKNKFFLVGQYSAGSSREVLIPGFGVSQNSVKIFAGGMPLIEGKDFQIDYTFGKVTFLNESILSAGKPISIQYEQSDPFAFQTRSLLGTRFDYKLSDEVNFGSTFLYYNERPLISRNQIGTEPARNVQYGFDFNINKSSRLLTKIVDAIPILQTKEQSSINVTGEFAQILPGTSNIIDGEGTAYVDDFENSATPYSLMSPQAWRLASTPIDPKYHYNGPSGLSLGYKRAKLAWYTVDTQFYRSSGQFKPENFTEKDLWNHYQRAVKPEEIFKYFQRPQGYYFQSILDMAYYPEERGPYNYSPNLNDNGRLNPFLQNPKDNWAGITTAIRTEVDFDKANIEYIEFWLLNPFIEGEYGKVLTDGRTGENNVNGGKLIFQLGNISEDVAKDAKHFFENGLPDDGNLGAAAQSEWGYAPTQQYLNNAFENSGAKRANQDVGLDGLPSVKKQGTIGEQEFFSDFLNSLSGGARAAVEADPSGDDFKYFFSNEFDNKSAQIPERYKNYNSMEGNSDVNTGDALIARSATQTPDNEDLNADNTLAELEEYYEYEIDLKKELLKVNSGYIVDKVEAVPDNESGQRVDWYLFRIPIRDFDPNRTVGNIQGFKSIRYMRMILTEFDKPVILRLANFRMIGSRWRRYQDKLAEGDFSEHVEPDFKDFTVSVVNLEENGAYEVDSDVSPYRIPPGVRRDRDNTSSVSRQLNEQAVQVCVDNLQDGDARAIFKNVGIDLFNYGRIKMYLHANSESGDDQVHAFLRLGTDFDQNFYEIEIPLKVTPIGQTEPSSRDIWPEANEIDLDLNELYALKATRDRAGAALTELYPREGPKQVGRHLIRIFGRPDLSSVQVMMIGIRNPKSDDQRSHSICVWANELRVTDFNRKPGWAISTTVNAKLADFATVTGALRHTTFGFGSVSSKIGERARDETTAYDVSASVSVDKLLPGNSGIKLPMFVSYENTTVNPNYDPANPDMKVAAAEKSFSSGEERSEFKSVIQDKTIRRSLNFVNVRKTKVKPDAKTHIYDIENFAFTYSYSEAIRTNFFIKEDLLQQTKGSVAYNFTPKSTGIEPFKNSKALKSPYFKLIKDFNLNLLPSNISIRGDLDRSFGRKIYRNAGATYGDYDNYSQPAYLKYFTFNRSYSVRWQVSRGLSAEYSARANAIIDEPQGDLDTEEKRDSVITNLKNLGRMKNFDQTVTVNYTLPLDKLPLTDWLGAEYRYQAAYNWKAGPINIPDALAKKNQVQDLPDSLDFRHTIQNSRDNTLSGKIDMVKLYNKIKFLKELNTPPKPQSPVRPQPGKPSTQAKPVAKADTVKTTPGIVKSFFRLLMSLRSINGNYSLTEGTILPGFKETPKFLGMDQDWSAPGWQFVLGSQNPGIRTRAAQNGWLVETPSLTYPFSQIRTETMSLRANVEPSSDFKIQIDLKKEGSSNYQEIFKWDPDANVHRAQNPNRTGNYKISFNTIRTAFERSNDDIESKVFKQFENNLEIIHQRFEAFTGVELDTVQDIVIPAFIAAYSGKDANSISFSPFPRTPLPNWRVDYSGLNKMDLFKEIFQSITISHGYQSTYSVLNFSNSLDFENTAQVGIDQPIERYNESYHGALNDQGQFVPVYVIGDVLISEQFAPLIGVNIRTKGRMTMRAEYKTKRDLSLHISNAQVTEVSAKDVSFELGYTKNNMKLPFKSQGRTIVLKNDVTLRMNVTVSDGRTIQRKIGKDNEITNGNVNFQLRPNLSYVVNQKLTVQAYFERTVNKPQITNSFPKTLTRFGIQVRFSLAQ